MEALAYWVISDHFEELGRPPALFHNGFGLLTVGNLRKPRYWAVHLAAHLGDSVLATELAGDGADVLVRAWATKHDDGTLDILIWNGTVNGELMDGAPRLERTVELTVNGANGTTPARLARIDAHHSNILDGVDPGLEWPDEQQWQSLRDRDRLHEEGLEPVSSEAGGEHYRITLPMPGVVRIRIPAPSGDTTQKEGSR
jgi:xylan 1,4-beta-xylosidase